ncbi:PREDICTED: binding partner of ACD11 1 [Tarenaya hassleriana]|uniref:binding partner of ACD11 1 n=1 Tax=Tarenaya hassleriana TaxID=28532 RepID=UPI00053C3904|nr:PREDICTED: binding partner of ACD11 1 [Tarenaya hassleriana]
MCGYIAEVTNLSPKATEKELLDFFSYCGLVDHLDLIRHEESACTAYVTFRDAYSLETALLLSGATIVDQTVCISMWGVYFDEPDTPTWKTDGNYSSMVTRTDAFASSPGEAVTVAQEVVKAMIARGYVLGKDVIVKAKALDESYKLTTVATAKFAELSQRIGLTQNIQSSMEASN